MALIEVHTVENRDEEVLCRMSLNVDHVLGTASANAARTFLRGKVLFYDGSELLVTETRAQLDIMINGRSPERETGTRFVQRAVPPDWSDD